jgi:Spy/CpxP family protein refolding chaperone
MKRIAFLMSIGVLAVMMASPLASPLAAQSAGTDNPNNKSKGVAELDVRIKKLLAEATALTQERERAAAAAGKPLPQRGSDPRVQKLLAEANALSRERERVAAAASISLTRGAPNTVKAQPLITVGSPFWRNDEFAKTVGLTTDQQKKMEEVFQQNRLKLIDLNGSLAKEESVLSALMADLQPEEESRVLGQIDRVAEVRAELEKTNARMLLGFRRALTPDQWNKLSTSKPLPEVKR